MMKKQILAMAALAVAAGTSHGALVAHYTFDTDGSASAGAAATLGSATSISTPSQVGAGSLSLSGAPSPDTAGNDGAVGGDTFTWTTDTRTVAFWVKAAAGDVGDGNATMISLGSGSGAGNRFDIRLDGNALRLEVQGGGSTTSSDIADGTWHHLVVVVPSDGATMADVEYYIDGTYVGTFSLSTTAIATGTGPFRMGDGYQDVGRDFKGNLDDVRLYTHALSEAEIAALAEGTPPVSGQPNVIFIMCDDLGYGDIYNLFQYTRDTGAGTGGIAGDGIINGTEEPFIHTPGIDRMAAEGVALTRHYTSTPVCAPARSSLLQGRDQGHATVRNNSFDKAIADNHTLGTVMQRAGYYTACVGKWGVGGSSPTSDGRPNNRGFDYFYGYIKHIHGHQHYPLNGGTVVEQTTPVTSGLDHAYSTDLWTAKTKQIIQDRRASHPETPFFIYLAYEAPHAQLQVPTQAYPAGRGIGGGLFWPLNTNSGINNSWIHPDYTSLGTSAKYHATMVRRIDDGVDDILQTLRDLGIDDNTLVVFTSDNGPHAEAGSGGSIVQNPRTFESYADMEGIKRDYWEAGFREPTFAWWPGKIGDNNAATPGLNSIRPSAFWDWMPTLVDAAGVTPPAWSSGVSLLPELTGTGTQLDKGYLYFEYSVGGSTPTYTDFPNHGGETRGEMQVIFLDDTDGKRYKGIRTGITSHTKDFQIYDIDADPGEVTNLAASRTALQQKMKDKVLQVRIDGDYSRPYSSENVPDIAITAISGLNYKAFTGSWDWVPETAYLVPTASGECTGFDLTKRTQDDHIAMEFTGYIRVPTAGTYTFSMTTDSTVGGSTSGGMLWIHDAHIIDDDFHHTGASKSGSMRLKAGLHPIRVLYKHATGSHDFALQYSGPGISMQPVPDSALLIEGELPPGPPVANDDTASTIGSTTGPGASILIDVLANDIDDGTPGPLTITDPGSSLAGAAVIESAKIRYTPTQGFFGTDHFAYTISDGQDSDSATVTVDVVAESSSYWYPLDEASGTIATDAGGAKPASLINFDSDPAQWVGGKFGNAVVFDGNNDYLSIDGYKGILGTAERTVSAWIKTTGTGQHPIIAWGPNSNDKKWTFLVQSGNLRIEVTGGYRQGATVINDGSWHHVACTFSDDGSPDVLDAKLYIDGVLETSFSGSAGQTIGTTAALDVRIGSDVQNRFFEGTLDDPRIYTRALSGSEIADLAAQTEGDNDSTHWYLRNLGNAEPTLVDWETDSNGDGYSHYAAYALGGVPHWFVPGMVPLFEPVPAGFEYLYNRRRALDPSDYIFETTLVLVDPVWSLVIGGTAVAHPELAAYERVTVPISTDGKANSFYRLKIAH